MSPSESRRAAPAGAGVLDLLPAAAAVAGAAVVLFAAAAAAERALDADPLVSALLEECGKAVLLSSFAAAGLSFARRAASTRRGGRRGSALRLGLARGLSLGLAAVAAFAGLENLAYALAFPDAGILARLAWSLPVHIVAALAQVLGFLPLASLAASRAVAGDPLRAGPRDGVAAAGAGPTFRASASAIAGIMAACAWHGAANLAAARAPGPAAVVAVALLNLVAIAALARRFFQTAWIGGFLHGPD